jgi:hypothetical protein
MLWYVAWAPTPSNGRLGVFIASPTILGVGQKQQLSVDGRTRHALSTVRCPPDMHCSLSGALSRQQTVGVYSSRSLDPTVTQTFRCTRDSPVLQPESAHCGPLYVDCSVSHRTVRCTPDRLLFTVRCTTSALADCPLHGFLCCFLGLLLFLSVGLLSSFYVFF